MAERSPLVDGIDKDGDFLDVGCANGLLAEDVVTWAREKGHEIVPHGVDLGARLVDLARERLTEHAANFVVADAWTWEPGRRWTFVYSLLDLNPEELWCEWLGRLHLWVEPGRTSHRWVLRELVPRGATCESEAGSRGLWARGGGLVDGRSGSDYSLDLGE